MAKCLGALYLFLIIIGLTSCASQVGAAPPELLVPVSVQHDTFFVQRGRVAQFEQHRGMVRVESEGVAFANNSLPFGGFYVVSGQEVREGDILARLDTSRIEERIDERRVLVSDLRAEHNFQNGQAERAISIAQIELLALTQQINDTDGQPDPVLLEAADLKRLEIARLQMDLEQAREWQIFTLSYYQSDLEEMNIQLREAILRAPFDGVVTYRAEIRQGTWLESFTPVIFISDLQNLFVEYSGHTTPAVFGTTVSLAYIEGQSYEIQRITLTPNELLFYTRAGANPPVRFAFIDEPDDDVIGKFVSIMLYRNVLEDVLRIPLNALYNDIEIGHHVYLIENGQRILQPIETGLRTNAWIEVRAGLLEGDEILVQQ